jgi:hypothetical protein
MYLENCFSFFSFLQQLNVTRILQFLFVSCSCVGPEVFVRIEDLVSVYTTVNYRLSFFAERAIPGFLNELWCTIRVRYWYYAENTVYFSIKQS